jgi:hypothetical protein
MITIIGAEARGLRAEGEKRGRIATTCKGNQIRGHHSARHAYSTEFVSSHNSVMCRAVFIRSITIRPECSESLAIGPHQATSAPPEWIRIASNPEIPTTVCFPAIPSCSNHCAKYQEASEGREPACARCCGAKFVARCFRGGEDGRRYRNRDNTTERVAVESDNSEDEDN